MIEIIMLIQMILMIIIVFLLLYMLVTKEKNKVVKEAVPEYSENDKKTVEQFLNLLNYEGDPYDKENSK